MLPKTQSGGSIAPSAQRLPPLPSPCVRAPNITDCPFSPPLYSPLSVCGIPCSRLPSMASLRTRVRTFHPFPPAALAPASAILATATAPANRAAELLFPRLVPPPPPCFNPTLSLPAPSLSVLSIYSMFCHFRIRMVLHKKYADSITEICLGKAHQHAFSHLRYFVSAQGPSGVSYHRKQSMVRARGGSNQNSHGDLPPCLMS